MIENKPTLMYFGNILSNHGLSVTTIETLGKQLEAEGYSIIYASNKKYMFFRMIDMVFVFFNKKSLADLILLDTYSQNAFWYAYIISLLCRFYKKPYIPILHGGKLPDRIKTKPRSSNSLFSNSFLNISPSRYIMAAFDQEGFDAVYIPNNIDITEYPFKLRAFARPKILYVRSFDQIYNPAMAIKVLSKVKQSFPDAELCMVGPDKDGSLSFCKDLAYRLGLQDSVLFTGQLPKKEWHNLSKEYCIFINTTNVDNMPVSIIEALALGLPIVSTNAGGLPYLLDDNKDALLVDVGNVDQMADAINLLLKDCYKLEELSVNGRAKAETFDWNVVKDQWNSVLS